MDPYIKLALETIGQQFEGNRNTLPNDLPKEMLTKKAGVFVSLHRRGQLRGCIGTIEPTTKNVALEIQQNAVSAAFDDPRFSPLKRSELEELDISVDILNEPILVKNMDELDIKKFGVIAAVGRKRGLLLPDIEGVESVSEQIHIACEKAGINPLAENFKTYKFTVTRHETE